MGFFRTEGVGFRDVGFKCVGCKVWVWGGGGGGAVGSKDQGEVRGPAHIITSLSKCTLLCRGG